MVLSRSILCNRRLHRTHVDHLWDLHELWLLESEIDRHNNCLLELFQKLIVHPIVGLFKESLRNFGVLGVFGVTRNNLKEFNYFLVLQQFLDFVLDVVCLVVLVVQSVERKIEPKDKIHMLQLSASFLSKSCDSTFSI